MKIKLLTILSLYCINSYAKPITLFIPPAQAQEINSKTYKVPDLKTRESIIVTNQIPSTTQQIMPQPTAQTANYTPPPLPPIVTHKPKPKFTRQQEKALKISEAYGDGSATPIAGEGGRVMFIYGQKQPTIICSPLSVCMIELEKDEIVLQQDAGDSVRWLISPPSNGVAYISIKPTEANIQTNYVVITNKRQYIFKLVSTKNRYMSLVSFKYPDTNKQQWDTYYKINQLNAKADQRKYTNSNALSGKNLDYNYSYIGNAPFKPIRTWTDNIKTYIQLPSQVSNTEIPIFNVLSTKSKNIRLVNQRYDYEKRIIEVDYKVEKGILQLGNGRDVDTIEIVHNTNKNFISER